MTILNVKDAAGNLIADNNKKVTVNVTADASAPAITDVKTVSDNLVEVTFDKAIAAGSLTSSAIKFVDGNLASLATVGTPTIKPNTSGKTVLVPLSSITFKDGKVSGNLVFTDAITDTTGNKLSATSKALTLTQDVAAPTVVSSKYVNKSTYGTVTGLTNGAIVVKFSEEVTKSAANTAYTVVNNKGEVVATAFTTGIAVNGDDKTELVLPLTAPVASGITSYKVVLPLSAVVDNSQAANASKSVNLNVDVSAGAVVADDTTAPVVASAVATGATTSTSGSSIAVTFTEANAMDSTTVTDINNYRLNGLPLPAGAYVTYNSTSKVATINIPAGSIAKTSSSTNLYSLNVTGVKDAAGNSINSSASTFALTGLADDVAPELKTATLNSVGQVVLGFSETLSAITAGDFVVKVNGTTTTNFTIIPGTGSDTGKYILTVNDGATPTPANLDLTKAAYTSVTVQAKTNAAGTADSSAVNTNAGNLLAGSQAITVK